jgi:ankyrin repeat protein
MENWLRRYRGYLPVLVLFITVGIFLIGRPVQRQYYLNITLIGTACTGNLEPTRDLLARGAEVDTRDENTATTPLMCAARGLTDVRQPGQAAFDHAGVLETLLDHGADINAGDMSGMTALMWAARNGCEPLVKILIRRGANVNATDLSGMTALKWAEKNGHQNIVDRLKAAGAKQ